MDSNPEIEKQSVEEQKKLDEVLKQNMVEIVTSGLWNKVKDINHLSKDQYGQDVKLVVSKSGYGDATGDYEFLYIGASTGFGGGTESTKMFTIGKRNLADGPDRVSLTDGYTEEDFDVVERMVNDLTALKESGEIPHLHQYDLSSLYFAPVYLEDDERSRH